MKYKGAEKFHSKALQAGHCGAWITDCERKAAKRQIQDAQG